MVSRSSCESERICLLEKGSQEALIISCQMLTTLRIIVNHTVFSVTSMKSFLHINRYLKYTSYTHMSGWTNIMFKKPSLELQQYVEVPLFNEKCFDPAPESMKLALELFVPQKNHVIKCISRTVHPEKFPSHSLPEVAVLGQSNAGKSSLLKAVFEQVPDLRIQTSKNPGHTKCLSFYQVGTHFCLVDMPGYGMRQPKWFESSVITYLKNRKNLVKTFMLVDCKQGFNEWDDAALQMMKDIKLPFAVVLTKIDTVADSQRLKNFLHVQNIVVAKERNCFPEIFMLSSITYEGLAYFIAFVAHITGKVDAKNS